MTQDSNKNATLGDRARAFALLGAAGAAALTGSALANNPNLRSEKGETSLPPIEDLLGPSSFMVPYDHQGHDDFMTYLGRDPTGTFDVYSWNGPDVDSALYLPVGSGLRVVSPQASTTDHSNVEWGRGVNDPQYLIEAPIGVHALTVYVNGERHQTVSPFTDSEGLKATVLYDDASNQIVGWGAYVSAGPHDSIEIRLGE